MGLEELSASHPKDLTKLKVIFFMVFSSLIYLIDASVSHKLLNESKIYQVLSRHLPDNRNGLDLTFGQALAA